MTEQVPLPQITKKVATLKKEVKSFESQILALMKTQNNYLRSLDKVIKKEKEEINLKKLNKKELREQVELVKGFSTRTKIQTAVQKMNNNEFNLGIKTLLDYRKAGGTTFEYLATFMTSTKEEVQILGFHASAARRVLYGFFPPGMFRIVNKLATGLNTLGGGYRSIKKMIQEAGDATKTSNNIFTSSFKLLSKLNVGKATKKAFTIFGSDKELKDAQDKLFNLTKANKAAQKELRDMEKSAKNNFELLNSPAYKKERREKKKKAGEARSAMTKQKKVVEGIQEDGMGSGLKGFFSRFGKSMNPFGKDKGGGILNRRNIKKLWNSKAMKKVGRGLNMFFSKKGIFGLKNWFRVGIMVLKSPFKLVGKAFGLIKMVFRPMMTFLVMTIVYISIISLIVVFMSKTIGEAWKFTKSVVAPFIAIMVNALASIWDGIKEVFSGIVNGDLWQIINGVLDIAIGVVQFVIGLALTVVIGLGTLVLKMAHVGAKKLFKFVKGIFTGAVDIKKNAGKILMLVAVVVALIFGWPVALGLLIIGLVPLIVKKLYNKFKDLFDFFSTGGTATGGMSVVGERGPELVKLPIGSRIKNNHVSKRTASSNRGGNTINITINAKDTSDAEMRRIAEKVGRLVNNSINRNTGMSGIR
jgi:ABC-type multidrug transport system fused ATPase/permease subunit